MPVKKGKYGPKEELYIMAGAMFVAMLAWYLILYAPANSKTKKLTLDVASLQDSLSAKSNYQAQTAKYKAKTILLEEKIVEWNSRFPHRSQIVLLTKKIIEFCTEQGLDLVSVEPSLFELYALEKAGAQVAGKYVMQLPLKFTLSGRYLDLGKMLNNLESLPFNLSLNDFNINTNKKIYPRVESELSLYLYVHI